MATAKRSNITVLRKSRVVHYLHHRLHAVLFLAVLVIPSLLTRGAIASAAGCGADFLFPPKDIQHDFYHLDSIEVTYRSNFSNPTLSCLCGAPGQATQKFKADNAGPFNGSAVVFLNFSSTDPCWFHLRPNTGGCGDSSSTFFLADPTATATATANSTSLPSSPADLASLTASSTAVAVASQEPQGGGNNLSPGARVALGIGITLVCLAVAAMAAFLYFRRRKRGQDSALAGAIVDHDRRSGRKAPEKALTRNGSTSMASGHSEEPLYPIQPVFDGYPGSMGYDDVRSLHSSINSHSPTGPHSPTLSHNGFWGAERPDRPEPPPIRYERSTERDELSAARLNSQPAAVVTSYGPNPVTPTLTPRASSRIELNKRAGAVSTDSLEFVPPMPTLSSIPDYTSYRIPPPAPIPEQKLSPPRKYVAPVVVSYGPNRVTPTPAVTSPTVPLDEGVVKRRIVEHAPLPPPPPAPLSAHERSFSWFEGDEPVPGSNTMGPLPPYASEADFNAMKNGAVRTLAAPQAEAELPPTKDGFYHYSTDIVEYELPGASPEHEPQLPFHPYKTHPQAGPSGGGGGGLRDIDEQKFLLSDVEMASLREQKMKIRAAAAAAAAAKPETHESYDLGERVSR
ncbi:hypothetical protein B0H63DRAFT_403532 [Podospora didyma]|uniref:Uncharacterized protein n=1 Tax=Podospora didyma TaxID=330526 RepID=A0AAE0N296_9PEZI|nr:hypothetical protein B0H63DRAFT_403532 [Podospora didyma]